MALLSDTSCKQIFTFPEMAKALLCAAVDQRWARVLSLHAFERVNASYVSTTGTQRHDDLVWRLQRARNHDLYLLVEFQSRPDLLMAERMHAYTALLSEELAKQDKAEGAQILPIVLYTGHRSWHVKTVVSTVSLLPPGLESVESQFSYLLIDAECIADQSNIVYLLLALNQAKHSEKLRRLLEKLNLWCNRQSNRQLVQAIDALVERKVWSETKCPVLPPASTLGEVIEMFDQQSQCFIEYFKAEHGREMRIKGMWEGRKHGRRLAREAGRQEGREEGREKGREEGRQQSCLEMINLILERRSIQLSCAAKARLEHADIASLNKWIGQLLSDAVPPELRD